MQGSYSARLEIKQGLWILYCEGLMMKWLWPILLSSNFPEINKNNMKNFNHDSHSLSQHANCILSRGTNHDVLEFGATKCQLFLITTR